MSGVVSLLASVLDQLIIWSIRDSSLNVTLTISSRSDDEDLASKRFRQRFLLHMGLPKRYYPIMNFVLRELLGILP
jgi:hypothetical protein